MRVAVIASLLLAGLLVAGCSSATPATTRSAVRTLDQRLDAGLKPTPPGVQVTGRVSTYEIGGSTIADARQLMAEQGMPDRSGRRWAGYTKWQVTWRWGYDRRAGCQISDAVVSVDLQVDVPLLSEAAQQDSTLSAWYSQWFDALFEHEIGHGRIARDGAREIYQRIRMIRGTACDEVGYRANQVARQVYETFDDRQRAYDASTAHGARPRTTAPR